MLQACLTTVLEEIPGFTEVTASLHDIMHDLFEGFIPTEPIDHCVSDYISKDDIDSRLSAFEFPGRHHR